ncbi:PKD domain-containing protein [bacterium]|nr:PKD domain-containing protein [bacterium]
MPCTISVAQPTGYRVDDTTNVPHAIHVEGTVQDCESNKILVELGCMKPGKVLNIPQGTTDWSVDFEMPPTHTCFCFERIVVKVFCVTEDGSIGYRQTFVFDSLPCDPLKCPIVRDVNVNIGDCNESGRRAVTLTAEIVPADANPVYSYFNFGDGTGYSIATTDLNPSVTHYYNIPGPYTAKLEIIIPDRCPGTEIEIPVLEPCDGCPPVMIDDIIAAVAEDCNDDGTRNVTLTPILNAFADPTQIQKYRWEFSSGIATIEIIPEENPEITKKFPAPGNSEVEYTVTFTVLRLDGCIDTKIKRIIVPGCQAECPKIENIDVIVGPCVSTSKRRVTLDATINGGGVSKYIWDFGDGDSEEINASSEDPRTTHEYNAPGHYTVTLTIEGPDQCRDSKQIEIDVPKCPRGPIRGCTDPNARNYNPDATIDDGSCLYDGEENGFRWGSLCCWLIYGWLITFISIWFTTQSPRALASAAGTSLALLIAWYFICCCGWKFWTKEFWKCANPFKNCIFLRWTILGHMLAILILGWAFALDIYVPPDWVWAALASFLAFWGWRFYASECQDRPVVSLPSTWPPCKCKKKK